MSLPALNTVSWPWMSSTRTAASDCPRSMASARLAYIAEVIEFFLSRRLKVRVITPASTWVRMSVMLVSR